VKKISSPIFIKRLEKPKIFSEPSKEISVVFRLDDYCQHSTDFDWKFINTFRDHGIPLTLGVIPYIVADIHDPGPQKVDALSKAKINVLKPAIRSKMLEIALHGYFHQTIRPSTESYTEFSGLNYENQIQRITEGKGLLERLFGVKVTTFIPPWNSYDLNTIQVLERTGFRTLSGGFYGPGKMSSKLQFLPATCEILELPEAIAMARTMPDPSPVIVVMLHTHDFLESGHPHGALLFADLVKLLKWVISQKDVHFYTITEATKVMKSLNAERLVNFLHVVWSSQDKKLLPPFLDFEAKHYFYPSLSTLHYMRTKRLMILTFFYGGMVFSISLMTFFLGNFLFLKIRNWGKMVTYSGLGALGLFSVYAFHDLEVHYKGAMILAVLIGMCLGLWGLRLRCINHHRATEINENE